VVAKETGVEGEDQMNFGEIKDSASQSISMLTLKEFNQLLQTGFLNLAGQGAFQPRPPPERPPLQPHPNISGIPIQPHISLPLEIPANDGWNEIVNPPQHQAQGWPTASFPLPPPPPKRSTLHITSKASHAHSAKPFKKLKSQIQEHKPSKGKQPAQYVNF
jgi:hypothetical protein